MPPSPRICLNKPPRKPRVRLPPRVIERVVFSVPDAVVVLVLSVGDPLSIDDCVFDFKVFFSMGSRVLVTRVTWNSSSSYLSVAGFLTVFMLIWLYTPSGEKYIFLI